MKDRTALVTGGSRGIGRAIVQTLRETGARVLAPARDELDLASRPSIRRYVEALPAAVDILVNVAGINLLGALEEFQEEELDQTLQVNVAGPLLLARDVARGMVQKRYGRIVNISSIWSIVAKPRRLTYTISKTALNGLTRALAVELAPHNVLVNAVAPGFVLTDLTVQNNPPQELDKIRQTIPLQRLAQPAEIAQMVAFLCSERNTYMTGQVLVVDGGFSCL